MSPSAEPRVHAAQHRRVTLERALHQRQDLTPVEGRLEHTRRPGAAGPIEHDLTFGNAFDEALGLQAIGNQIGDRQDPQPVPLGEILEIGHARHGAVVFDDFADDGSRGEPGKARQVDRALGLPGADQDPARACDQREGMAGHHDVVRFGLGTAGDAHGVSAIGGADAGRHPFARLDRHGEGRAERGATAAGRAHQRQIQALDLLVRQRQANQAAAMHCHEVDRGRRHAFGGHAQIAFVFPILVVDQDHQLAGGNVFDRGLHPPQRLGRQIERARFRRE